MKRSIIFLLVILFVTASVHAQINVGSNNAPDSSAMLQISGTTKGFLPPRMTRDSMYLIHNPAKGLLIFNTTDSMFYFKRDSGWTALGGTLASNGQWVTSGNNIYNANNGNVGIGTSSPSTALHVVGTNPLTLNGVQPGTNTSSDSVLTINNGLVTELPLSTFASSSNGISIADAPLTYSNGEIGITQASTTSDGYVSASDYNIFNNKVSSISINLNTLFAASAFALSQGAATGTLILNNQIKNKVFAGPVSGANAQPTFRSLVGADLPIATTNTSTGLGGVIVGSGLSVNGSGVLSVTNPSAGGSVTSTSVVSANGLAGTVANATTTPAITLSTTVTGMVKGNGTALSAATSGTDYAPGTAANATGIVKSTTGTGALTTATASDFPTLNQNTTGTAANITGVLNTTSLPALTGDVTSTSGSAATTISNSAVTNAKMANMAANTFKANATGSAAAPTDITATQATAMLNTFTSTTKGLVPSSGGGTSSFLRADGTFAVPPGTNTNAGTVTSVSVTSANGVSGTVATSTTTPAISLTLGAITPSSVAATGTVTGSNLSGTNTGDETVTTIKTKLGPATATTDGYLTSVDWNTFNNKATATGTWSTTGNSGTNAATNFLGTTDNTSLRFRSNNLQRMIMDSLGNLAVGSSPNFTTGAAREKFLVDAGSSSANPTPAGAFNVISGKGYLDNYLQLNIQNFSPTASASSDIVASNDAATETANFIDMGINSSANNSTGAIGGPNTAYLYSTGGNLAIGNGTANKSIVLFTGGLTPASYTERIRLDSNGRMGIGTSAPSSDLSVYQSAGTGGSRGITFAGNSIGGTSSGSGFLLSLGYNLTNNKQLWLGDPDYANNATGTFLRYSTGGNKLSTLDAVAGDNSSRRFIALGVGGDANGGVLFGNDGSVITPGSYVWDNGNMAIGNGYRGNAAPSNGLLVQGNVGIGTATPSTALHVVGTNPLTLNGVQTGTNTSADSLLTITSGLVRKLPLSTFTATGNAWSITGNAGTSSATNFLGTTDNASLLFKTNNAQGILLDSLGNIGIGASPSFTASPNREKFLVDAGSSANPSTSFNVISGKGYINNYLQLNIQNKSNQAAASSDVVASNDAATETTNFIDMGVNSSGNTSTGVLGGASTAYLYGTGTDFAIGNGAAGKNLNFFTTGGSTSAERMRIDSSGRVGIGTSAPATALHVSATANPLTLNGVQTGTNTTADSLLTITSGLVRKLPLSTFAPTGSWSTTGNTGTNSVTNFLGTVDNNALRFRTNNISRMQLDSAGGLFIGDSASSYSNTVNNTQAGMRSDWTTSLTSADVPRIALQGQMRVNLTSGSGSASVRGLNGSALVGVNSGVTSNADIYGGYFLARRQSTTGITEGTGTLNILAGAGIEYGHTSTASSGGTTSNVYGIKLNPSYASGTITNMYGLYASAPTTGGTVTNQYDIYLSAQSLTGVTNSWGIYQANTKNNYFAGNTGIGTTTFNSSNPEKFLVDAGASGNTNFQNVVVGKGNTNSYAQLNIQNTYAGTAASSDVVATADNGNETSNYVDLGINSSANTANFFGGANDAYLYAQSQNMLIGTASAGKSVVFLTGGGTQSTNERMRIDGNGRVGIGTSSPTDNFDVVGTSGSPLTSAFNSVAAGDRSIVSVSNTASGGASVGLRAHGSSYSETILGNSMTGASTLLAINSGSGILAMGTFNAGDVVLGTNNAERMRLTAGGNVGIGTNAPTAVLQLKAGTSTANTAPLKLTSGTNLTTPEAGAVEFDGTNYYATSGTTRYTLAKTLTNTAVLDFPNTSANSVSTLTVTVTGARDGDVVVLGVPSTAGSAPGAYTAYVSGNDTVTVKFSNGTGNGNDPLGGTFRVSVLKY